MTRDPLKTELRALAQILQPLSIPLIVGGGYGLFLRSERIRQSGEQTLMPDFPDARSTEDVDIFLTTEVIADSSKMKLIRVALDRLGYLPATPNLQFVRSIDYMGRERQVKIDFLAAPVTGEFSSKVKISGFRMRSRDYKGLHAYVAPEALTVEENLTVVDIGEGEDALHIYLPHPFSYLVLKLFALRDQVENEGKEYGRNNAFDIYATIATMTQQEWDQAVQLRNKYADAEEIVEASELTNALFADFESLGTLRLREHVRSVGQELPEEQIIRFLEHLQAIFAAS